MKKHQQNNTKPETKVLLSYGGKPVESIEELKERVNEDLKKLQDKEYLRNLITEHFIESFLHRKCNSLDTQSFGGFSILFMANEEVCTLMLCNKCQLYYFNCYHDQFIGGGDFTYEQEIAPKEVEIVKEAILKCEDPHDKHCRCKYHEKLGEILYRDFMEYAKKEMPKKGLEVV